ncbi:MAG: efflux RND transporter permease subunit [Pseudomonadota bacterium]
MTAATSSEERPESAREPVAGRIAAGFYSNPLLLALTLLILSMAGLAALGELPRLEDPRITQRFARIATLLPGATAERVEALVTEPLEDLLDEIDEIKDVTSTSRANVSSILVELDDSVTRSTNQDIFAEIRAKLRDAASVLPAEATAPVLDDKRGAVGYGAVVAIRWADGHPEEQDLGILGRTAERLADRLRLLPGTELVRFYGAPEEEINVLVDPQAIAAAGLSVAEVAQRIDRADAKSAAGSLRSERRELALELSGELDGVERIARIPLRDDGNAGVLTVGEVASIAQGWRTPERNIALYQGQRSVLVAARPVVTERIDLWGEQARETVSALRAELGTQFEIDLVFDQSEYVDDRLSMLSSNLFMGATVIMLIVLLLMGWRAAIIVGLALPLSSAIAMFGLATAGLQLHQMTIFGLLIAIGLLIDNAIVVTDDVQRRLSEHGDRPRAAADAVNHLLTPLFTSTFTTVLGFMPIFLLKGNIGDFVGPIAVSVIIALVASFALSISVIPALAARYLGTTPSGARVSWWKAGLQLRPMSAPYRKLLGAALAMPRRTILVTASVALCGFVAASQLGLQFFPGADRDQFEIEVWLSPDTSVNATLKSTRAIEASVREEAGIAQIDWVIGASFPVVYYNAVENQDDTPSYAHGIVTATSVAEAAALVPRLQRKLSEAFIDARIVVSAFGQGPPIDAPVAFELYGPSPDELARYGAEVRRAMHEVPGLLHSSASVEGGQPKLRLDVNEYAAHLSGLTLDDISGQLQASLDGGVGGSVLRDTESLAVRVRMADAVRGSVREIADLRLLSTRGTNAGEWIPTSALGELTLVPEKSGVSRRNGERVNNIYGYTADGVLPIEVTREILQRLDEEGFTLPPGYRLQVAGESESQAEAVGSLAAYAPLLGVAMATTIILSFSSLLLGAVIGAVAFLSVGLGMLSLYLAGYPLGFNPLIGSAGLIGVAINGSIVVLAAILANPKARAGEHAAMVDEVVHSTRHLVATSLTTTAGFGPLLISGGNFWPPLAVVIAGGVALSLMLSIGFTPACYAWLTRRAARASAKLPRHAPPVGDSPEPLGGAA